MLDLETFLLDSNRIEGIKTATFREVEVARDFLDLPEVDIGSLTAYVNVTQPDAILRDKTSLNVRVGAYLPPPGGPHIVTELNQLLWEVNKSKIMPFQAHVEYERLHPFTDGNGRSGRLLWLWQMMDEDLYAPDLSFLHAFYYQTLREKHG